MDTNTRSLLGYLDEASSYYVFTKMTYKSYVVRVLPIVCTYISIHGVLIDSYLCTRFPYYSSIALVGFFASKVGNLVTRCDASS